jgi:metal-responsive CopG/Arc/MetJ family transcriptional regulator
LPYSLEVVIQIPKKERKHMMRDTKEREKQVTFLAPVSMITEVEEVAARLDTDRSKFIRQAVREKLNSIKTVTHPTTALSTQVAA